MISNGTPGYTLVGAEDVDGNGSPDLIYTNNSTGQISVNYFNGVTYTSSAWLDSTSMIGWQVVVPDKGPVAPQTAFPTSKVLLYRGTGVAQDEADVWANLLSADGISYDQANESGANGLVDIQKLANNPAGMASRYQLLIVPGGNSITIGNNLSTTTTANIRTAVSTNGLRYLGICAGMFFADGTNNGQENNLNLTGGNYIEYSDFYPDYFSGVVHEPMTITFHNNPYSPFQFTWWQSPKIDWPGAGVIGSYPNGMGAIVYSWVGKGYVVLSGPHPDAPASWRTGDTYATPIDEDWAYATHLAEIAYNATGGP
jgi:glutamine amidotransferase-like uncharacterized protein